VTGGPERGQGPKTLTCCTVPSMIGILHEGDLDAIDAESLTTLAQAAVDDGDGEVPAPFEVARDGESLVVDRRRFRTGDEQATDLRGQQEVTTRVIAQSAAEPTLGEPEAVVRRRVEVAHAARPRPANR